MADEESEQIKVDDVEANVNDIYKVIKALIKRLKCDSIPICIKCPFWDLERGRCTAHILKHPENYFIIRKSNMKAQLRDNSELKALMELIEEKKGD